MQVKDVFDASAVRRLEADTQSRAFVRSLVDTYCRMLGTRVDRIVEAVAVPDPDSALDAAHSLRVSSVMTGAVELAELSSDVVDAVRAGDLSAARETADLLPDAADRAREALGSYLLDEPAPAAQGSTDSIR